MLNKEQESQIQSPKLLMSVHDTQIQILTLETGPLHQFWINLLIKIWDLINMSIKMWKSMNLRIKIRDQTI